MDEIERRKIAEAAVKESGMQVWCDICEAHITARYYSVWFIDDKASVLCGPCAERTRGPQDAIGEAAEALP